MTCRYGTQRNQTITHLRDMGLEEKTEIIVRCDGEWHTRESFINRHGKLVPKTIVCMCPDFSERWAVYVKREYKVDGWKHVSLRDRRV